MLKGDLACLRCDARQVLPQERAQEMLSAGFRIQHVADAVRFFALRANHEGGWFVDLDVLWLRRTRLSVDERGFHHILGQSRVLYSRHRPTYWLHTYLKEQGQRCYMSIPIHYPGGSPLLA